MFGFKTITLSAMILASTAAFADIRVTDDHTGLWVKVEDSAGQPDAGAKVMITNLPQNRTVYTTNDSGRVFIPISLPSSRSVKLEAVTSDGEELSRYALFSTSND
uniref:carboxypeptidase regulatory-like domain-containing protein n=1 Tax=Thaumasiovibrio occultus TaxID=1891184 RepID=UPI000B35399A|nr:carboxypeptidase regulatory-like domain-containing protein [Thaumasiovibrio occultus]